MTLFSKVKKIMEEHDACVLSKEGKPVYVVIKWDSFQKIKGKGEELSKLKSQVEEELKDEDYEVDPVRYEKLSHGVDINKIPI